MLTASSRVYAGLNDYLPDFLKQRRFRMLLRTGSSITDMLEILGIPPSEVYLVIINGEPADFSFVVQADDRISVFPEFHALDIALLTCH